MQNTIWNRYDDHDTNIQKAYNNSEPFLLHIDFVFMICVKWYSLVWVQCNGMKTGAINKNFTYKISEQKSWEIDWLSKAERIFGKENITEHFVLHNRVCVFLGPSTTMTIFFPYIVICILILIVIWSPHQIEWVIINAFRLPAYACDIVI